MNKITSTIVKTCHKRFLSETKYNTATLPNSLDRVNSTLLWLILIFSKENNVVRIELPNFVFIYRYSNFNGYLLLEIL